MYTVCYMYQIGNGINICFQLSFVWLERTSYHISLPATMAPSRGFTGGLVGVVRVRVQPDAIRTVQRAIDLPEITGALHGWHKPQRVSDITKHYHKWCDSIIIHSFCYAV